MVLLNLKEWKPKRKKNSNALVLFDGFSEIDWNIFLKT